MGTATSRTSYSGNTIAISVSCVDKQNNCALVRVLRQNMQIDSLKTINFNELISRFINYKI